MDETPLVNVFVPGAAVGQGSLISKSLPNGRVITHHPAKIGEYRLRLAQAFAETAPELWLGPAQVVIEHRVPRPAGHFGRGRNAARLKPWAPVWPITRGADIDKVCRVVNDSLTDAGVWRDDSQCVSLSALRVFAGPEWGVVGLSVRVVGIGPGQPG